MRWEPAPSNNDVVFLTYWDPSHQYWSRLVHWVIGNLPHLSSLFHLARSVTAHLLSVINIKLQSIDHLDDCISKANTNALSSRSVVLQVSKLCFLQRLIIQTQIFWKFLSYSFVHAYPLSLPDSCIKSHWGWPRRTKLAYPYPIQTSYITRKLVLVTMVSVESWMICIIVA